MSAAERAAAFMENLAADPKHGYDQQYRWGERGDYDCSSALITAWELAGVPVKSRGASYTGNMYRVFLNCGFEDVSACIDFESGAGLCRGDVLLNHVNHTALYVGEGKTAEANINELGKVTGGEAGDQTGREILVRGYRNFPWDCVLRYTGDGVGQVDMAEIKLPYLRRGSISEAVRSMQLLLEGRGFSVGDAGADGDFGSATAAGVVKFQKAKDLSADGICGPDTWSRLLKG